MIGIHHWKSSPTSVKCSIRKSIAFPYHGQRTLDAGGVNAGPRKKKPRSSGASFSPCRIGRSRPRVKCEAGTGARPMTLKGAASQRGGKHVPCRRNEKAPLEAGPRDNCSVVVTDYRGLPASSMAGRAGPQVGPSLRNPSRLTKRDLHDRPSVACEVEVEQSWPLAGEISVESERLEFVGTLPCRQGPPPFSSMNSTFRPKWWEGRRIERSSRIGFVLQNSRPPISFAPVG
jgi:hypothetical protein